MGTPLEEHLMQKELTITVEEDIYEELNRVVGPAHISQFIESLIRPHIVRLDLESAYQQMAQDESREREALEWSEATIGDAGNETR
jgi:predicted CopG family antitoxin